MDKPLPAYRGDEPYVFVCYSHADEKIVYPEIRWLQDQGVRIWYDEGISAGRIWRAEIGEAIEGADKVLFYISAASLKSDHCNREVSVALDDETEILPVYLEDTPLTPDLKVGLARLQAIHRTEDEDYQRHLMGALGRAEPADARPPAAKQRLPLTKYAAVFGLVVAVTGVGWWYLQERGSALPAAADIAMRVEKPRIAVLPFDNLSGDVAQEFFSEGITEDILNGLAHSPGVVVRARSSSFSFKGQALDTKTIAERLNITHIVSGSVRTSGNRVRVNARLTAVDQDVEVWSHRYDRELIDVFAVQDEITGSILNALDVHFSGSKRRRVSVDAYNAYLLGRYHLSRFELPEARSAFENAIDIEQDYVDALSSLAQIHGMLEWMGAYSGGDFRESDREKARVYTDRALRADPDAPVVRASEPQTSLDELSRLIRLYPSNSLINFSYGATFRSIGRFDLESRVQDQYVALNPLDTGAFRTRGETKLFSGHVQEALKDFGIMERMGGPPADFYTSQIAFYARDIETLERLVERDPVAAWALVPQFRTIMAAAVPYLRGDQVGVRKALSPLAAEEGDASNLIKFWIALLSGENQLALEHYLAALREGDGMALHDIQGSQGLRSLFPEYFAQPGYEAMLREFGLDAESVAKLVIPDLPF